MNTVTVISAHSEHTMDLIADTRFDVVLVHIKDRDGNTVGLHDAPREAFVDGVEQLKSLETSATDEALPEELRTFPWTPPLTVADLSAKHIGKKVRVTDPSGDAHTGYLEDLRFTTEQLMHGHVVTSVECVFHAARIGFPLTAIVEVLS